ncbi:hypothetical protein GGI59_006378 [Rhizobium lentis]|uniref:Uncharacterized protein n=1 Tax=Rhizobium lentis TaxID=1138194 RepID=A0A7W8XKM9_9HYPH|nr:hypothetical protein [Rhizobium lentis]MBB5554084.1 hypothetical protein [Rhizobium lentis]MBB5564669.1 hypothetical protein [Rhizobium lentis]MBB5571185.1 hypothetical protein [Rhizobium lentis]
MIVSSGSRGLYRETKVGTAETAPHHRRLAVQDKVAHYAGAKNRQRQSFNKARMEWTSISTTENG